MYAHLFVIHIPLVLCCIGRTASWFVITTWFDLSQLITLNRLGQGGSLIFLYLMYNKWMSSTSVPVA